MRFREAGRRLGWDEEAGKADGRRKRKEGRKEAAAPGAAGMRRAALGACLAFKFPTSHPWLLAAASLPAGSRPALARLEDAPASHVFRAS